MEDENIEPWIWAKLAGCDIVQNEDGSYSHSKYCRRCELSMLSDAEADVIAERLAKVWIKGKRAEMCKNLCGTMIKGGYSEEDCQKLVYKICILAHDEQRNSRKGQVIWHYRQIRDGTKKPEELLGKSALKEAIRHGN